jgi:deoxyribose-phosphate aldolase
VLDLATIDAKSLGKYCDQSVLFKWATESDIRSGCKQAVAYNCAAFYASSPHWLPVIIEEVAGSGVHAAAAISFPDGTADWRTDMEGGLSRGRVKRCPQPSSWTPLR